MSRNCDHAIEYIYNYIDEELTWSRRMRIRWHLRKCTGCDDAFIFEQSIKRMVQARGTDAPPPELLDRLRTLIQEEGPGSPQV